ncbi:MAG: VWA domain-containing protein [Myxococcota bacterium]
MRALVAAFLVTATIGGCTDGSEYAQAICALIDTSGTYADQRGEVLDIIQQGLLPKLLPGDSLMLIRIDSDSYAKENLEARLTLDHRPSHANAQKMAFADRIDELRAHVEWSKHTDITGAMMLCTEYLAETGAGTRTILIFSDMKEELPRGTTRTLDAKEFEGTRLVAMNVKRLRADNADPGRYRKRLERWGKTVTNNGASDWRVIHDPDRLLAYLYEGR